MSATTGELHARAKALGLKGAGEIEPIARAAFRASAESLGELGGRQVWDELGSVRRRAWRSAVLAALEALPESAPAPFPVAGALAQPEGGLKPGDVVSVRGVVRSGSKTQMLIELADDDHPPVWVDSACLTFIERPAPPEPDWQPSDLAEDDDGARYFVVLENARSIPGRVPRFIDSENRWLRRDEIPGPLYRLTVTREDAP